MPRSQPQHNIQIPLSERRWSKPPQPAPRRFGPGTPALPQDPERAPRVFDYPGGINLVSVPRAGFGVTGFSTLRNLAAACKEVRLNIELIKRELRALAWKIVPHRSTDKDKYAAEIRAAEAFFRSPDRQHDFDQWLGMLLEDVLAIDAPAIWPELDASGKLRALEIIDGSTIRPLLDRRGRIAPPPLPAYSQVIQGLSASWYTRERLIYRPFNVASNTPYGTSPTEYIQLIVNLAMRRDTAHVSSFTHGNVPEALVGMPQSWTQPQIQQWQDYWDAMVEGNPAQQSKIHFIPHEGAGQLPVYPFRKDSIDTTARDEWMMRVACWAFGNSPSEFGLIPGSGFGGKGFTKGMENIQYRSMIGPLSQYLSGTFDLILARWMGFPALRFKWIGMDPQDDQFQQAQIDQIYIPLGVYSLEYVQDRLGVPPSMRPDGPPQPAGLPFGFAAAGALAKVDDDPDEDSKAAHIRDLRQTWQSYLAQLRGRIVEALDDPAR